MRYVSCVNEQEYVIQIDQDDEITVDDRSYDIDFKLLSESGVISLLLDRHSIEAIVEERGGRWEVLIHGELYTVEVQDERAFRLAKERGTTIDVSGEAIIKSPMPGLIVDVLVTEGETVKRGQKLVILESMKMENELRSPRDGHVAHVYVEPGNSVEKNQTLVVVAG